MTKILVIDADRDAADNLAFLFDRLGHELKVAYDGKDAVPLTAAFLPHIIFLDLVMPGVDGFATARQIRDASPITDHPFIVALAETAGAQTSELIKTAGFDAYLTKPADFTILLMLVDSLQRREHPSKRADTGPDRPRS